MEIIDNKKLQYPLRLIAALLLPFILILDIYGLIFIYSSVVDFTYISLILGLSSLFGTIGYIGAWYRITKQRSSMSTKQVTYVRRGLILGITASLLLLGLSFYTQVIITIIFFMFIAFSGIVFLYATPKQI